MIKNNSQSANSAKQPDKTPVNKVVAGQKTTGNSAPKPQTAKLSWWRRLSHFGKLFGDVSRYVFDEDGHAEKIKNDLSSIEAERLEERRRLLAKEKEILEMEAKRRADERSAAAAKLANPAKEKTAETPKRPIGGVNFADSIDSLLQEKIDIVPTKIISPAKVESQPLPSVHTPPPAKPSIPVPPTPVKPLQPKSTTAVHKSGFAKDHKLKMAKLFAEEYAKAAKIFAKEEVENRYWQSMNLVRANLIKEQKSLFFNWRKKFLTLMFFVSSSLLVSLLSYGGLLIFETSKKEANRYIFDNLASINAQINAEHSYTQEIDNFNNRLTYVNYLLDNHIYWTRLFAMLENRTVNNVYYQGLTADLSGQYKLPAVSKNFADITNQIGVLMINEDQNYKGLSFNGWVSKADSLNAVIVDQAVAATSTPDGQSLPSVGPKPGEVAFTLDLIVNPAAVFIKR